MKRSPVALHAVAAMLFLVSWAASAQVITEFSAGISAGAAPAFITAGPDGNLWFTEQGTTPRIGRITPTGTVTEFGAGITGNLLEGIAAGPDGNLWFTERSGAIGRITPTGTVTEFTVGLTPGGTPWGITNGPDGNLWFTDPASIQIGRITPTGTITMFSASPAFAGVDITTGPDGNLWFTDFAGSGVARITPTGTVTEFTAGITVNSSPYGIARGPDGNLWFAEQSGTPAIGRITTTGTATEFTAGIASSPWYIAAGADGNLWFTQPGAVPMIGRITPTGTVAEFGTGITAGAFPLGITAGPDGNLWFAEQAGRIGRITTGGSGLAATTTGIVSSLNPATVGQSVTFTATVTGSSPTGTVQFKDGATSLGGAVTLSGGSATFTTSALAQGVHSITTVYSGDPNNATSTSPALTQTVDATVAPPPPPGQPIPALSEWSLLALAFLVVMLGVASIGKRGLPTGWGRKS